MKYLSRIALIMIVCTALSLSGNKRGKENIPDVINQGNGSYSLDQSAAASSPWLPVNLDLPTSQYRLVEYANGAVWFAGARTTAPLVGNYYGYRSKDSGKTWIKFSMPVRQSTATSTSMRFANVSPINDTVAILADYYGYIMRTENGGVKWDTVAQPYGTGAFYNGIKFVNSTTAIAMGDKIDSTVYFSRSTDGGKTWARVNVPNDSVSKLFDYGNGGAGIIASNGNNVWVSAYDNDGVVNHPGVYKSTDAGATWTLNKAANLETSKRWFFRNLSFSDANLGYAVSGGTGHTGKVHKTTDGGVTWSDTINIEASVDRLNQQVIGVHAIAGTNHVIAVGYSSATGSKSWWSTDAGVTWTVLNTPGNTTTNLNSAAFITPTIGFAVGSRNVLNYTPTVEVTFVVNTSTVPDTLKPSSTVQMRGDDGNLLRWDGSSSVRFANIGGDYWQVKARFAPGKTFPYKLYTNANANVGAGHAQEHAGWEANLSPTNDRMLTVGNNDTTLAVQFVNGVADGKPYFWRPYTESDSIEVTFRINMATNEDFNKATMKMGVRGGTPPLDWGNTRFLTQEGQHGNGGSRQYDGTNFWSVTLKFPATTANGNVEYKFVQHNAADAANANPLKWEDGILPAPDVVPGGNRFFNFRQTMADSTLYWKWWANVGAVPPKGNDTVLVTYRVDMSNAISKNSFVIGDTVVVRAGFANSGGSVREKMLARQGLTFFYQATDTVYKTKIDTSGKTDLYYQYYLIKNGLDLREVYYNFNYTGTNNSLAERRSALVKTKSFTVRDTIADQTKQYRQPFWRNTRKLSKVVAVTFTLNLQPAYWQVASGDTLFDIQGPWNVTNKDSVYKWGVAINGPAVGGWDPWGASLIANPNRKLYDDGTHGDATAGDRIYTNVYTFGPDSANGRNIVGQEFKFGINGGDNEGGKGGFGNNHIENINDANATATIASQFGSINPLYYDQWDFGTGTKGVGRKDDAIPGKFALEQNYPNPFNPTTTINYSIPVNGLVSLKVFNILGQEVMSLVNAQQTAGNYQVTFNANTLSSGVYFYRIDAGSFSSVKKMMLMK